MITSEYQMSQVLSSNLEWDGGRREEAGRKSQEVTSREVAHEAGGGSRGRRAGGWWWLDEELAPSSLPPSKGGAMRGSIRPGRFKPELPTLAGRFRWCFYVACEYFLVTTGCRPEVLSSTLVQ